MTAFTLTEDFPRSEIESDARFSNPEACYAYLFKLKWPDGFVCPRCGYHQYWFSSRKQYICTSCQFQSSLTAETIMGNSKKPITYFFKAMWWFTTRKSGINAVNLKELLGFRSYQTAWTWLQKLRRWTIREKRQKLSGRVEVDEFFLGATRSGKRGRGAIGKTIVAVAVERRDQEIRMGRIRLHVALILDNIEPGSTIATDDLRSYNIIDKERFRRETTIQSKSKDYDKLYGARLVTTLIKRLIRGTYEGRFEPKYLQNYLDEYVFRFNHRKSRSIGKKFMRIVQQAMKTPRITWPESPWDLYPLSEYFVTAGAS